MIPSAPHCIRMRHMYANFRVDGHKGLVLKDKLWKAVAAYTIHGFGKEMEGLKKLSPAAHAYLKKIDTHIWARAFFDTTPKCDLIMNNLCECFIHHQSPRQANHYHVGDDYKEVDEVVSEEEAKNKGVCRGMVP